MESPQPVSPTGEAVVQFDRVARTTGLGIQCPVRHDCGEIAHYRVAGDMLGTIERAPYNRGGWQAHHLTSATEAQLRYLVSLVTTVGRGRFTEKFAKAITGLGRSGTDETLVSSAAGHSVGDEHVTTYPKLAEPAG